MMFFSPTNLLVAALSTVIFASFMLAAVHEIQLVEESEALEEKLSFAWDIAEGTRNVAPNGISDLREWLTLKTTWSESRGLDFRVEVQGRGDILFQFGSLLPASTADCVGAKVPVVIGLDSGKELADLEVVVW